MVFASLGLGLCARHIFKRWERHYQRNPYERANDRLRRAIGRYAAAGSARLSDGAAGATRGMRAKAALVRLVRGADGAVVLDRAGTAHGRGAYVCADDACIGRALQRGRLAHAFRASCEASGSLAEEARGLCQRSR